MVVSGIAADGCQAPNRGPPRGPVSRLIAEWADWPIGMAEAVRLSTMGRPRGRGSDGGHRRRIQKVADTVPGNANQAFIVRCTNTACTTMGAVSEQRSQPSITTWAPNKAHTLTLTWDGANDQFVYSVKPVFGGKTETVMLPYAESDANQAVGPFACCRSTTRRPTATAARCTPSSKPSSTASR
jgi:hypothetical protein